MDISDIIEVPAAVKSVNTCSACHACSFEISACEVLEVRLFSWSGSPRSYEFPFNAGASGEVLEVTGLLHLGSARP